jgi:CII-binding regulator of phage lambda lysogenization HflD
LDNVKNLRLDLFKLRTSFSNASLSYSEFVSPLKKYCSTSLLTSKKHLPAKEALHSTLKDRLERISKKLKDAKREI